jgi:hypothetical protein
MNLKEVFDQLTFGELSQLPFAKIIQRIAASPPARQNVSRC